jgi:hypothetical protein
MSATRMLLCLGLFWALPQSGLPQNAPEVNLRIVKYAGLTETVLKHRGQVVLIDFWGYF